MARPNQYDTPWTPEMEAELTFLYGHLSPAALADRFGVTRMAVIGKAARLGVNWGGNGRLKKYKPQRHMSSEPLTIFDL